MFCPNCSQELPDGARFCPACGQKIDQGFSVTASQPVAQPQVPAQPQQPAVAPAQPQMPQMPQQPVAQPVVQPDSAQPQASGFYPADASVPPTPPVSPAPAPAGAQPEGGKPKKKTGKLVGILIAVVAFVIASQAGQCAAESFLEDSEDTAIESSDSSFDMPEVEELELEDIVLPPDSDIVFDDTYDFGPLVVGVNSAWEPDSSTDEVGDTVCYFYPFGNNEICLQEIDMGIVIEDDEVQDYSQIFIDGLAESEMGLENGTCYATDENGKQVLEWDGSFELDGIEYGVSGKTYFVDTKMVAASYAYPLSDADDGFSRALSFLGRVEIA